MEDQKNPGEKPVIVLSSVTYALKSRDLLFRHGIRSYVERLPRTKENGCGYGIYVPQRSREAEQILRAANIRIVGRSERGDAL